MMFPQHKKKSRFLVFAPQAVLLAVISIFFLSAATQGFLKSLSYKIIDFFAPERMELEKDRDRLAMLARIRDLEAENKKFAELLSKSDNRNIMPLKMNFGGGYLFLDTFFLESGADAVKTGNWVVRDWIFLGKIVEAGAQWAKFKSIGSFGERAVFRAGAAKDIVFEAEGIGGGELKAEFPALLELNVGDPVWWGEDSRYLAGFIEMIRSRETSPFIEVIILMPIKIERLSEVEVML